MKKQSGLVFAIALAFALPAQAEIRLPAIFCDHVVLQAGAVVPVWGWAEPGEIVTVEFAGQHKNVLADAAGKWLVKLDPLKSSAEPRELLAGNVVIRDVLVGEVWLCGGQSNMERQLGPRLGQPLIQNWQEEVASANFPLIRHFGVAHKASREPLADVTGSWAVCSPATVKNFTAVGYFFGRELHKELKVPIGLVHCSWGGTGVATWTSKAALGDRLAKLALTQTYGHPGDAVSPMFQSATVEGHVMRIKFTHATGGLMAKEPLQHFTIAGADRNFVPDEATIDGQSLVVASDKVPQPVAVRYAWADNPEGCNLFNKEDLPATPFRTDDWPGVTVNAK